ncbi:MAG: GGDEF domain-containing protein [Synergistaceae bacterium]|nr:GGDEF domain-containing protein [Synergistaceae bacterium]
MATQNNMTVWGGVLDSCPGLLCCVINIKGKLLHATHGYKAVASRLFGHKCEEGRNYPPLITDIDMGIHDAMTAACLGDTNAIEISDNGKIWELSASPLRIDGQGIAGVVLRITSGDSGKTSVSAAPVIYSNPEILNSVPFRAGVVNSEGVFMAVNRFLASCVRADLVGRNIIELISPENNSDILHILLKRTGSAECTMPDISAAENFYPFDISPYLDEDLSELPGDAEIDTSRRVILHATPIEWSGLQCVLLTFEDVTDFRRTHEQLRRLLTADTASGVLNRRGMEHIIARNLHDAMHSGEHLSLIIMRVDNYRIIHDARGYSATERIIRGFVRTTQRYLKERGKTDFARWNNDDFMILSHCSGAAAVIMSNEIRARGKDVVLSAGVADVADGGYMSAEEMIDAAYSALSEATESGGNVTVLARNS